MLHKEDLLSPENAKALRAIRSQLLDWLFRTKWNEAHTGIPYAVFSGPPAEELMFVLEDLSECGWSWTIISENSMRISPDRDREPSSEILPTPAELEVFCEVHEMMRQRIKNFNPDPLVQNEMNFPSETPERVMQALVCQLQEIGWKVKRDGKVHLLIS